MRGEKCANQLAYSALGTEWKGPATTAGHVYRLCARKQYCIQHDQKCLYDSMVTKDLWPTTSTSDTLACDQKRYGYNEASWRYVRRRQHNG